MHALAHVTECVLPHTCVCVCVYVSHVCVCLCVCVCVCVCEMREHTHIYIYIYIQDYYLIREIKTWLNINYITVHNNTLYILKLKEQLLKIQNYILVSKHGA